MSKPWESDFDRSFRRHRIFVNIFIGVVFTIIIACWGFMAFVAYHAADSISEVGVRGVLSSVWCGKKNPGCFENDLDNLSDRE